MKEKILKNIIKNLEMVKKYTSTPGEGVTRLPFTKEAKDVAEYLVGEMREVGLAPRVDESGAIIGRIQGTCDETIIIGSHYDSVENGGAFDGIAGVVCGIEVLRYFRERNIHPKYSIEVMATNDEEGARFNSGFLSSKAMLGKITMNDLKNLKDRNEISIYEAMKNHGLNPQNIYKAKRDISLIKSFLEIHIEQGPILEKNNKDIGIVNTIVGMKRGIVTLKGREDHAGTTPMNVRIDAIDVAAKVISEVSDIAKKYEDSVATVGKIEVLPNAINTIAKEVKFSLDIRSVSKERINNIFNEIIYKLNQITDEKNTGYTFEETLNVKPVDMNENLINKIEDVCLDKYISYQHINSGAGHDALVIGEIIDTAMIFVPSKNGRSHCAEEFTDYKYLVEATFVAIELIKNLEGEK